MGGSEIRVEPPDEEFISGYRGSAQWACSDLSEECGKSFLTASMQIWTECRLPLFRYLCFRDRGNQVATKRSEDTLTLYARLFFFVFNLNPRYDDGYFMT